MRVAIIGAGVAGLATAKVLRQAGHEVVVFDRTPDVGGVWSRTRRYPGLTTQSPKAQYSLSDFPMPKSYPEWPSGEQVQAYLAAYAARFGLDGTLRLNTEVVAARPAGDGWILDTRDVGAAAGGATTTAAFAILGGALLMLKRGQLLPGVHFVPQKKAVVSCHPNCFLEIVLRRENLFFGAPPTKAVNSSVVLSYFTILDYLACGTVGEATRQPVSRGTWTLERLLNFPYSFLKLGSFSCDNVRTALFTGKGQAVELQFQIA